MRLIDADAYIEKNECCGYLDEISVKKFNEITPTIDAVEYKKGKWIHIGGDEWVCDKCGFVLTTAGSWEHPLDVDNYYCKHCGTDMQEEL